MDDFDIPDEIMNKHFSKTYESKLIQGALDGIVSFSKARHQLVGKVRNNAEINAIASQLDKKRQKIAKTMATAPFRRA